MAEFKDHFSTQSKGYGLYRPTYPVELYRHLAKISTAHDLMWDCATGTGQAARGLAPYFRQVIATDASAAQVGQASGPDNVLFRVARGEQSGLSDKSVNLITVAQALHWFAETDFFEEVRRVIKPGGIFAAWTYNYLKVAPEIDRVVNHYCDDMLGDYWPPERQLVDTGYKNIIFPFTVEDALQFDMCIEWSLAELTGYLDTWSAVARYKAAQGQDPMDVIRDDLLQVWGDPAKVRQVRWPLTVKISRF